MADGPDYPSIDLRTPDNETLRPFFAGLNEQVEEAKVRVGDDGLRVRQVDPSNTVMHDGEIDRHHFSGFTVTNAVGDEALLGMNIDIVSSGLTSIPHSHAVHLYTADEPARAQTDAEKAAADDDEQPWIPNKDGPVIRVEDADTGDLTAQWPVIDPDSIREEPDIPDLDLDAEVTLDARDYKAVLQASKRYAGDHISFAATAPSGVGSQRASSEFFVHSDADTTELYGTPEYEWERRPSATVSSLFNINYAKLVGDAIRLRNTDEFRLEVGEEFPFKAHYDIGPDDAARVTWMVAPRIQSDGISSHSVDAPDEGPMGNPEARMAADREVWEEILDVPREVSTEGHLHVSSDGFRVQIEGSSGVQTAQSFAPPEAFDQFQTDLPPELDEIHHGMNVQTLAGIVSEHDMDERVEFRVSEQVRKMGLVGDVYTVTTGLFDSDSVRSVGLSDEGEWTADAEMSVADYQEGVSDLLVSADNVAFGVADGRLYLYNDGDRAGARLFETDTLDGHGRAVLRAAPGEGNRPLRDIVDKHRSPDDMDLWLAFGGDARFKIIYSHTGGGESIYYHAPMGADSAPKFEEFEAPALTDLGIDTSDAMADVYGVEELGGVSIGQYINTAQRVLPALRVDVTVADGTVTIETYKDRNATTKRSNNYRETGEELKFNSEIMTVNGAVEEADEVLRNAVIQYTAMVDRIHEDNVELINERRREAPLSLPSYEEAGRLYNEQLTGEGDVLAGFNFSGSRLTAKFDAEAAFGFDPGSKPLGAINDQIEDAFGREFTEAQREAYVEYVEKGELVGTATVENAEVVGTDFSPAREWLDSNVDMIAGEAIEEAEWDRRQWIERERAPDEVRLRAVYPGLRHDDFEHLTLTLAGGDPGDPTVVRSTATYADREEEVDTAEFADAAEAVSYFTERIEEWPDQPDAVGDEEVIYGLLETLVDEGFSSHADALSIYEDAPGTPEAFDIHSVGNTIWDAAVLAAAAEESAAAYNTARERARAGEFDSLDPLHVSDDEVSGASFVPEPYSGNHAPLFADHDIDWTEDDDFRDLAPGFYDDLLADVERSEYPLDLDEITGVGSRTVEFARQKGIRNTAALALGREHKTASNPVTSTLSRIPGQYREDAMDLIDQLREEVVLPSVREHRPGATADSTGADDERAGGPSDYPPVPEEYDTYNAGVAVYAKPSEYDPDEYQDPGVGFEAVPLASAEAEPDEELLEDAEEQASRKFYPDTFEEDTLVAVHGVDKEVRKGPVFTSTTYRPGDDYLYDQIHDDDDTLTVTPDDGWFPLDRKSVADLDPGDVLSDPGANVLLDISNSVRLFGWDDDVDYAANPYEGSGYLPTYSVRGSDGSWEDVYGESDRRIERTKLYARLAAPDEEFIGEEPGTADTNRVPTLYTWDDWAPEYEEAPYFRSGDDVQEFIGDEVLVRMGANVFEAEVHDLRREGAGVTLRADRLVDPRDWYVPTSSKSDQNDVEIIGIPTGYDPDADEPTADEREDAYEIRSPNRPLTRQARDDLSEYEIIGELEPTDSLGHGGGVVVAERPPRELLDRHELRIEEDPVEVWENPSGERAEIYPDRVLTPAGESTLSPEMAAEISRERGWTRLDDGGDYFGVETDDDTDTDDDRYGADEVAAAEAEVEDLLVDVNGWEYSDTLSDNMGYSWVTDETPIPFYNADRTRVHVYGVPTDDNWLIALQGLDDADNAVHEREITREEFATDARTMLEWAHDWMDEHPPENITPLPGDDDETDETDDERPGWDEERPFDPDTYEVGDSVMWLERIDLPDNPEGAKGRGGGEITEIDGDTLRVESYTNRGGWTEIDLAERQFHSHSPQTGIEVTGDVDDITIAFPAGFPLPEVDTRMEVTFDADGDSNRTLTGKVTERHPQAGRFVMDTSVGDEPLTVDVGDAAVRLGEEDDENAVVADLVGMTRLWGGTASPFRPDEYSEGDWVDVVTRSDKVEYDRGEGNGMLGVITDKDDATLRVRTKEDEPGYTQVDLHLRRYATKKGNHQIIDEGDVVDMGRADDMDDYEEGDRHRDTHDEQLRWNAEKARDEFLTGWRETHDDGERVRDDLAERLSYLNDIAEDQTDKSSPPVAKPEILDALIDESRDINRRFGSSLGAVMPLEELKDLRETLEAIAEGEQDSALLYPPGEYPGADEETADADDQREAIERLADGEWTTSLIAAGFGVSPSVASMIHEEADRPGDVLNWNENLDDLTEWPGIGEKSAREIRKAIPKMESAGISRYDGISEDADDDEETDTEDTEFPVRVDVSVHEDDGHMVIRTDPADPAGVDADALSDALGWFELIAGDVTFADSEWERGQVVGTIEFTAPDEYHVPDHVSPVTRIAEGSDEDEAMVNRGIREGRTRASDEQPDEDPLEVWRAPGGERVEIYPQQTWIDNVLRLIDAAESRATVRNADGYDLIESRWTDYLDYDLPKYVGEWSRKPVAQWDDARFPEYEGGVEVLTLGAVLDSDDEITDYLLTLHTNLDPEPEREAIEYEGTFEFETPREAYNAAFEFMESTAPTEDAYQRPSTLPAGEVSDRDLPDRPREEPDDGEEPLPAEWEPFYDGPVLRLNDDERVPLPAPADAPEELQAVHPDKRYRYLRSGMPDFVITEYDPNTHTRAGGLITVEWGDGDDRTFDPPSTHSEIAENETYGVRFMELIDTGRLVPKDPDSYEAFYRARAEDPEEPEPDEEVAPDTLAADGEWALTADTDEPDRTVTYRDRDGDGEQAVEITHESANVWNITYRPPGDADAERAGQESSLAAAVDRAAEFIDAQRTPAPARLGPDGEWERIEDKGDTFRMVRYRSGNGSGAHGIQINEKVAGGFTATYTHREREGTADIGEYDTFADALGGVREYIRAGEFPDEEPESEPEPEPETGTDTGATETPTPPDPDEGGMADDEPYAFGLSRGELEETLEAAMPGTDVEFFEGMDGEAGGFDLADDAPAGLTQAQGLAQPESGDPEEAAMMLLADYDTAVDRGVLDIGAVNDAREDAPFEIPTLDGPADDDETDETDETGGGQTATPDPEGLDDRLREVNTVMREERWDRATREQHIAELVEEVVHERHPGVFGDTRTTPHYDAEQDFDHYEFSAEVADEFQSHMIGGPLYLVGGVPMVSVAAEDMNIATLLEYIEQYLRILDANNDYASATKEKLRTIGNFSNYAFEQGKLDLDDLFLSRSEARELALITPDFAGKVLPTMRSFDMALWAAQRVHELDTTEGLDPEEVAAGQAGGGDTVLQEVQKRVRGYPNPQSPNGILKTAYQQWLDGEFDHKMFLRNYYDPMKRDVPKDIFADMDYGSRTDEASTGTTTDEPEPEPDPDPEPDPEPDTRDEPSDTGATAEEAEPTIETPDDPEPEPEPDETADDLLDAHDDVLTEADDALAAARDTEGMDYSPVARLDDYRDIVQGNRDRLADRSPSSISESQRERALDVVDDTWLLVEDVWAAVDAARDQPDEPADSGVVERPEADPEPDTGTEPAPEPEPEPEPPTRDRGGTESTMFDTSGLPDEYEDATLREILEAEGPITVEVYVGEFEGWNVPAVRHPDDPSKALVKGEGLPAQWATEIQDRASAGERDFSDYEVGTVLGVAAVDWNTMHDLDLNLLPGSTGSVDAEELSEDARTETTIGTVERFTAENVETGPVSVERADVENVNMGAVDPDLVDSIRDDIDSNT